MFIISTHAGSLRLRLQVHNTENNVTVVLPSEVENDIRSLLGQPKAHAVHGRVKPKSKPKVKRGSEVFAKEIKQLGPTVGDTRYHAAAMKLYSNGFTVGVLPKGHNGTLFAFKDGRKFSIGRTGWVRRHDWCDGPFTFGERLSQINLRRNGVSVRLVKEDGSSDYEALAQRLIDYVNNRRR